MRMTVISIILLFSFVSFTHADWTDDCQSTNLPPGWNTNADCESWPEIDNRPIPKWYDDAKFGIFLHWGLYSVPSYGNEWYWHNLLCGDTYVSSFHNKTYGTNFLYQDFTNSFHTELFDADEWVSIIKASGAKYFIPTAKHHDGYTLWKNNGSSWNWNAVDTGPHRDLIQELATAASNQGIGFGIYHSKFEFFNPLFLQDRRNNYTTNTFVTEVVDPQRYDLINRFKPVVWHEDGAWMAPMTYWNSRNFLDWVVTSSPVASFVATEPDIGQPCDSYLPNYYHGDSWAGDCSFPGKLVPHHFTNQCSVQKYSWSYDRSEDLSDYKNTDDLIFHLVATTSWNGTYLLNIGPTWDGRILPIFEERLRQIGSWLATNGEAIFNSRPYRIGNDTAQTFYTTQSGGILYGIYTSCYGDGQTIHYCGGYPKNGMVTLNAPIPTATTTATLLGYGTVQWTGKTGQAGINITLPSVQPPDLFYAWTIKLTNVQ